MLCLLLRRCGVQYLESVLFHGRSTGFRKQAHMDAVQVWPWTWMISNNHRALRPSESPSFLPSPLHLLRASQKAGPFLRLYNLSPWTTLSAVDWFDFTLSYNTYSHRHQMDIFSNTDGIYATFKATILPNGDLNIIKVIYTGSESSGVLVSIHCVYPGPPAYKRPGLGHNLCVFSSCRYWVTRCYCCKFKSHTLSEVQLIHYQASAWHTRKSASPHLCMSNCFVWNILLTSH